MVTLAEESVIAGQGCCQHGNDSCTDSSDGASVRIDDLRIIDNRGNSAQ